MGVKTDLVTTCGDLLDHFLDRAVRQAVILVDVDEERSLQAVRVELIEDPEHTELPTNALTGHQDRAIEVGVLNIDCKEERGGGRAGRRQAPSGRRGDSMSSSVCGSSLGICPGGTSNAEGRLARKATRPATDLGRRASIRLPQPHQQGSLGEVPKRLVCILRPCLAGS